MLHEKIIEAISYYIENDKVKWQCLNNEKDIIWARISDENICLKKVGIYKSSEFEANVYNICSFIFESDNKTPYFNAVNWIPLIPNIDTFTFHEKIDSFFLKRSINFEYKTLDNINLNCINYVDSNFIDQYPFFELIVEDGNWEKHDCYRCLEKGFYSKGVNFFIERIHLYYDHYSYSIWFSFEDSYGCIAFSPFAINKGLKHWQLLKCKYESFFKEKNSLIELIERTRITHFNFLSAYENQKKEKERELGWIRQKEEYKLNFIKMLKMENQT